MPNWLDRILKRKLPQDLGYDDARQVLEGHSKAMREQLAGRDDAPPEMLYYLAGDEEPAIRQLVAANQTTPIKADELLADDAADEVRAELARKIARLVPDLPPDAQARMGRRALAILEKLAQDQVPRVRQIVAEELKETDNVPRPLIQKLAHDVEIAVCGPVLEYSPLLSDDDLIEIIATTNADGALEAIANRRSVAEPVADQVIATLDIPAVAALLANPNAQIREEALEQIIDQAEEVEIWHKPIAMRPDLSLRAVRRIAGFVARSLLDQLSERNDLDEETRGALNARIQKRIATDDPGKEEADRLAAIQKAFDTGQLDDELIVTAAENGRRAQVVMALQLMAGVPGERVEQVFAAHSGKGIAALTWKAGLGMRTAHVIQRTVGRVPKDMILLPRAGFDYPLTEDELNWHLNFFEIPPGQNDR